MDWARLTCRLYIESAEVGDVATVWVTGLVDGDYDDVDEQAFYLIGDMSTLKTTSSG